MLGRTLSHYEITQELSRGGMGVVYRARDTKLDREVALKVLPPELMEDETRKRRFVQEAKAAAAIHHPNIATIHEIDEADGVHFIVMELIEGEKLTDLLARERLTPSRVLELVSEIAEGLSKAHDKGVVHRDLKPSNIMITVDGHIKIIDFGLAKLLQPLRSSSGDGSDAETGLRGETDPGQIMGTVSYMSPEQARGESVDSRSDIFSFGILLYEMLSGRLPFQGKTGTDTLSAILRDPTPRLSETEHAPELQHVLNRCLAKEADERYQTARDLLAELKHLKRDTADSLHTQSGAREPVAGVPRRGRGALLAALALAAALVLAIVLFWGGEPDMFVPRVGRTIQITRDAGLELDGAISPDGKMVAYAAGPLSAMKIYVQQVAGGRPVPLTEDFPGAHRVPRWFPDGTRIAFSTRTIIDSEIYIVPALGGAPRRFPAEGWELVWSPDGERVTYATDDAIFSDAASGGEPRRVTDVFWPSLLSWSPDGEHLAFTSGNPVYVGGPNLILNIAPSSIWVVAASGGEPVRITEDAHLDVGPVWTPDGKSLLFVSDRGGARDIYRVLIDPSRGPAGEPERLTIGLNVFTIALSADGRMLSYSVITSRQNIWSIPVPQRGPVSVTEVRPVTTGNQTIEGVDVSTDGNWLVFDTDRSGNQDIFKMSVGGGEPVQLTTDPTIDCCPSWSSDGKEVAFHAFRTGNRDIFVISSDGGTARQLTNDPAQERYPHWSPDGSKVVFQSGRGGSVGIYVVSQDGGELAGETPKRLAPGLLARWSPDGRLIAYTAGTFPGEGISVISPGGGEPRVLTEFGHGPMWSRDGDTIFFRVPATDERAGIWSVPLSGGEPELLVRYDDPSRLPLRSEWSTDGESFYFTLTEFESDVWVMELESSSE